MKKSRGGSVGRRGPERAGSNRRSDPCHAGCFGLCLVGFLMLRPPRPNREFAARATLAGALVLCVLAVFTLLAIETAIAFVEAPGYDLM
jgi:hypothetical protein